MLLEVRNVLQVVHVEEDYARRQHRAEHALDGGHLILAVLPHVREEDVKAAIGLRRLELDERAAALKAEPHAGH